MVYFLLLVGFGRISPLLYDPSFRQALACLGATRPQKKDAELKTEEKANVVAAVWGTEFIQFLAAQATFHQDDLKNMMNCTQDNLKNRMNSSISSNHPGSIHPILQFVFVQNSWSGKELNKFCPPNSGEDLCIFFCIYISSMNQTVGWQKLPV